jgi:hypothetical protein
LTVIQRPILQQPNIKKPLVPILRQQFLSNKNHRSSFRKQTTAAEKKFPWERESKMMPKYQNFVFKTSHSDEELLTRSRQQQSHPNLRKNSPKFSSLHLPINQVRVATFLRSKFTYLIQ